MEPIQQLPQKPLNHLHVKAIYLGMIDILRDIRGYSDMVVEGQDRVILNRLRGRMDEIEYAMDVLWERAADLVEKKEAAADLHPQRLSTGVRPRPEEGKHKSV